MSEAPFSRILDTGRVGSTGYVEHVTANESERAAVAKLFGLEQIGRLEADLRIEPWRRLGLKLEGRVKADVVQTCVVSAEPVPAVIDEAFTRTFLPPEAMEADPKSVAEAEVIVQFDEEDPPDALIDRAIDLGSIVAEQLALALDPYPRAPGAAWPEDGKGDDPAALSPFSALGKLRDK